MNGKTGRPPGKRDARGLTPAMVAALPIMASINDIRAGILDLAKRKIVCERVYYQDWQHDEHWLRELETERTKYFGSLARRTQSVFLHQAEHCAQVVVDIALGNRKAGARQLDAALEVLDRAGALSHTRGNTGDIFRMIARAIAEQTGKPSVPVIAFGMKVAEQDAETVDFEDVRP